MTTDSRLSDLMNQAWDDQYCAYVDLTLLEKITDAAGRRWCMAVLS